ncbi:hypothetical protein GN244_ATG14780 [Phytophthora infestans]|uniref:Uncharacterized protein n=1 Tax=Phytophthora infestans TaxID=4787 RepID=A0A833W8Y5_PHYIN|nr:hypothetical protein GN244_ATG14780 [Phytophthora infestans]
MRRLIKSKFDIYLDSGTDERVQRDLSSIIQFDDKQDKAPVRSMYPFIDHRAWYPPSKYPELQHVLIVPGVYDDKSFKPLELKAYDSDFMNENKEYTAFFLPFTSTSWP